MSRSAGALIEDAHALADELWSRGGVKRSTFGALLARFRTDGDREQLTRLLRELRTGSGGHIRRGRGFGDQVDAAAAVLESFLARSRHTSAELQTIFGWAGRDLLVFEASKKPRGDRRSPTASRGRQDRSAAQTRGQASEPTPAEEAPPEKIGGLKGSAMAALLEVKGRLPKK